MSLTRAERETVIRYSDDPTEPCSVYTASPVQARRWRKLGYDLTPIQSVNGEPTGWQAAVPRGTVKYRRLADGKLVKRAQRPSAGVPFGKHANKATLEPAVAGGE